MEKYKRTPHWVTAIRCRLDESSTLKGHIETTGLNTAASTVLEISYKIVMKTNKQKYLNILMVYICLIYRFESNLMRVYLKLGSFLRYEISSPDWVKEHYPGSITLKNIALGIFL